MPFNSISFIFFFLIFTVLYYYFENPKYKTLLLLASSYAFYAHSNIFNLVFLLSTTAVTFVLANHLIKNNHRKFLFILGIAFIAVQLVFAKYSNFLFDNISADSFTEYSYFNLFILPIGISFYSLQAISLLADIKSGKYKEIHHSKVFRSFFVFSLNHYRVQFTEPMNSFRSSLLLNLLLLLICLLV